jgi:hypothetical protein
MQLDCEVIPRPGAMPAELKALGTALLRWYVRECGPDGVAHSVDTEALIELLNGRVPAPRVPRLVAVCVPSRSGEAAREPAGLNGYERRGIDVEQLRQAVPEAQRPAALLRLREGIHDRARVIASLRRHIPADLVGDVLLDGQSWDIK